MVVVGVREPLPVSLQRPAEVVITNKAVPIVGNVTTERSAGNADRVVLVGWEHLSFVEKERSRPNMFQQFGQPGAGLPVVTR